MIDIREKFRFEVGDRVQIAPWHWSRELSPPYCYNGPDHVYTVVRTTAKQLFLEGRPQDTWTNPSQYLIPYQEVSEDAELGSPEELL